MTGQNAGRRNGSAVGQSICQMERVAGIEPARPAWEAGRLPLHHTRPSLWLPLDGAARNPENPHRPHRKVSSWNHAKGERNMNAGHRVAFPGALWAVDPPVPGCFAARETDFPALTGSRRAGSIPCGNGGRPEVRPCFRALTGPSLARPGIRRRPKRAMAPRTWNTGSPAADVESIRSPGPIGLICLALRPSTVPWSSLGERPGRSGRMTAGVSLGLARSSGAAGQVPVGG